MLPDAVLENRRSDPPPDVDLLRRYGGTTTMASCCLEPERYENGEEIYETGEGWCFAWILGRPENIPKMALLKSVRSEDC